jgi:hypothetical protein
MTVRFASLWCGVWLLSLASIVLAEDTPPRIKPEDARMHLNKQVEVVFEVKHTKHSEHRKTAFLDSEDNFQDEKNLGIAITEAGIQDLKQKRGVDGPADYYHGKTIRVTGTVSLKEEKVYIEVTQAEQLDLASP